MYLRSETSCWSARCCPEILLLLMMMTALDMDCLPYYLVPGDCLDYMLLMMSLAWPSTMMMMLTMALTMVLTDPALAEFLHRIHDELPYLEMPQPLHRSHDELPLVLPQPEMPQLPQQHGCQDELPLVLQTDDVLPQPEPGPGEQLHPLHSLAEGGLTMISLAWGGVVSRILLGEEDLATLRCFWHSREARLQGSPLGRGTWPHCDALWHIREARLLGSLLGKGTWPHCDVTPGLKATLTTAPGLREAILTTAPGLREATLTTAPGRLREAILTAAPGLREATLTAAPAPWPPPWACCGGGWRRGRR